MREPTPPPIDFKIIALTWAIIIWSVFSNTAEAKSETLSPVRACKQIIKGLKQTVPELKGYYLATNKSNTNNYFNSVDKKAFLDGNGYYNCIVRKSHRHVDFMSGKSWDVERYGKVIYNNDNGRVTYILN